MLDKKVFIEGLNKLLNTFTLWSFDTDNSETLKVWYGHFEHMDNERYLYMIDAFIGHSERYPTIAGLKKCDTIPRKSADQLNHEQMLRENGLL